MYCCVQVEQVSTAVENDCPSNVSKEMPAGDLISDQVASDTDQNVALTNVTVKFHLDESGTVQVHMKLLC